jgi:hypothetical protein
VRVADAVRRQRLGQPVLVELGVGARARKLRTSIRHVTPAACGRVMNSSVLSVPWPMVNNGSRLAPLT